MKYVALSFIISSCILYAGEGTPLLPVYDYTYEQQSNEILDQLQQNNFNTIEFASLLLQEDAVDENISNYLDQQYGGWRSTQKRIPALNEFRDEKFVLQVKEKVLKYYQDCFKSGLPFFSVVKCNYWFPGFMTGLISGSGSLMTALSICVLHNPQDFEYRFDNCQTGFYAGKNWPWLLAAPALITTGVTGITVPLLYVLQKKYDKKCIEISQQSELNGIIFQVLQEYKRI